MAKDRQVSYQPGDQEAIYQKNPAAVALGRLGGLQGGPARALRLSAEERSEIARYAAHVRWSRRNAVNSQK